MHLAQIQTSLLEDQYVGCSTHKMACSSIPLTRPVWICSSPHPANETDS